MIYIALLPLLSRVYDCQFPLPDTNSAVKRTDRTIVTGRIQRRCKAFIIMGVPSDNGGHADLRRFEADTP